MERKNCVICKNDLHYFFTLEKYPYLFLATEQSIKEDIFTDFKYGACITCKSVQLLNLVDPALLYSYPNKHSLTPLWILHHKTFSNFIKNSLNIKEKNICEIGGGNNNLLEFIKDYNSYSVLDLYEPIVKKPNIAYKIGNCESFTNYNEDTLILSHTFEHLYNPIKFVETLKNTSINDIIISIPDMKYLLESNSNLLIVFSEHTYYLEKEDLINMFSSNGFTCKKFEKFNNHSLFFHFERNNLEKIDIHIKENAYTKLHNNLIMLTKEKTIVDKPLYIMPSHYIGQSFYLMIKNNNNILGFLDNDINKIGKRLYGTPHIIQNPNILKKNSCVLLINNSYSDEMYEQLKKIDSSIEIIKYEI